MLSILSMGTRKLSVLEETPEEDEFFYNKKSSEGSDAMKLR
jgi:hypothetical protein